MAKTKGEVDALIKAWILDPSWDIEDTEGFEEHKCDLLAFRISQELAWDKRRQNRLLELAQNYGIPGNTTLANLLESMLNRIKELEDQIRPARSDEPDSSSR